MRAVVLSVDFAKYAKALDADDGECLYVVGEITDLAQKAQRQLGFPTICLRSSPVGRGRDIRLCGDRDSPANTLGGAVALGFENRLTLPRTLLPGRQIDEAAGGAGFSYGFGTELPNDAYLIVDLARMDELQQATGDAGNITLQALDPGQAAEQLTDAIRP